MLFTLIIPGNLEILYCEANNSGNMGFAGIFLELYYKRNLFYLSFLTYLFFNAYIGLFITTFTLFLFIKSYYRWKKFILPNSQIHHHYS